MARYRKVGSSRGPGRLLGCLVTLLLVGALVGAFVYFGGRSRSRRLPPPRLDRWEETEPGRPAAARRPAETPQPLPAGGEPGDEAAGPADPPATDDEPADPARGRSADAALAAARACLEHDDAACCIAALEGADETREVVTALLSCYERAGRAEAGCALAGRHPDCRPCQTFASQRCN